MPRKWLEEPPWLAELVNAVMTDIEGGQRLFALSLFVVEGDEAAALGVGIAEQDGSSVGAGSNEMISPATPPADALVTLAQALQEKCAETQASWGQSRPPCPYHSHPLRAEQHEGEAWWICQQRHEPIYRIGRHEVRGAAHAKRDRRR